MKKVYLVIALILCLSVFVTPVFAEDVAGTFFDTKVLPYLTMGGTGIAGALAVVVGSMRSTKAKADAATAAIKAATDGLSTKFTAASDKLELETAKLEKAEAQVQTGIANVSKDVSDFTTSANKTISELKAATEASQAEVKSLKTDIVNIKGEQSKTLQAILIAFTNNTELVKNGYATKIAELMKVGAVSETTEAAQTKI